MKLRTFTAPDMNAAMNMVRAELGDEAVILSSGKQGARSVSVTAAIDRRDEFAPAPAQDAAAERSGDVRFELQNILRFHNLPELFVAKMMQKAASKDMDAAHALHRISGNRDPRHLYRLAAEKLTAAYFQFAPLAFDDSALRIMLVGTPGAGKTLTAAKIAARMAMDKQPLTVVTTDNKRAGGVEQLKAFTDILGLELKIAPTRGELLKHINDTKGRVLIDTAGCNPYDDAEFKELAALVGIGGIEPVLVIPAGGDSMEAIDAAESFSALPIKRLLVTRADTARRFGGVMAAAAAYHFAFSNASYSASIIDPLHPADPTLLAQLLLRYQS